MAKKEEIIVPDFEVNVGEETQQTETTETAAEPKTKTAPKAKTKGKEKKEQPPKENPFQKFIKAYLDKKAEKDEIFAQNYKKPKKSIERCVAYIITQMAKKAFEVKGQGKMAICCGMDADLDKSDVINFAVHYYDEDDLAIDKVSKEAVKQVTEAAQVDVPDMSQFDFDMF
jgi:hypothetical protein